LRRSSSLSFSLSLSWSLVLMLAFSPMCWRANFGILVPLVFLLIGLLEQGVRVAWVGVLSLFALSRVSPYWLGDAGMITMGQLALPLWLAGLALWSTVAGTRGRRS
jgi:hypothetical protein